MKIDVNYDEAANEILVALDGDLDLNNVGEFKRTLDEAVKQFGTGVAVDCSGLRYIDSTGLGVLVGTLKKVKEIGGGIKLLHLKPYLFKIFDITGLSKVFEIEVAQI